MESPTTVIQFNSFVLFFNFTIVQKSNTHPAQTVLWILSLDLGLRGRMLPHDAGEHQYVAAPSSPQGHEKMYPTFPSMCVAEPRGPLL